MAQLARVFLVAITFESSEMKANEFVKMYGWDVVKDMLQKYPKSTHVTNDAGVFINSSEYKKHAPWFADDVDKMVSFDDLERLVESYELVERMGGDIEEIKAHANHVERNLNEGVYFKCVEEKTAKKLQAWKQAINDVESCQ